MCNISITIPKTVNSIGSYAFSWCNSVENVYCHANPDSLIWDNSNNDYYFKSYNVTNIAAMAEMADAAGIKVIICTVTPNNDTYSRLNDPKTKGAHIITLNGMLKEYTDSQGFTWCNYWSSLVAEDGLAMDAKYWLY